MTSPTMPAGPRLSAVELSGTATTAVPEHSPRTHRSFSVPSSASSQNAPSSLSGLVHAPVWESHTPTRWHWDAATHVTPTHTDVVGNTVVLPPVPVVVAVVVDGVDGAELTVVVDGVGMNSTITTSGTN